jgi:flagellar hook-associated protein 1 FlgK
MSLNGALQIGRSAIVASQAAMQVAGNNMANAATKGFHRRTVHLAGARDEMIIAGAFAGTGVQLQAIRREVDTALQSRYRDAVSQEQRALIDQRFLTALETLQNELTDNDLSSALSDFFNSFSELANNPEDHAVRSLVVEHGLALADRVAGLGSGYQETLNEIDRTLGTSIISANDLLDRIATLNAQITQTEMGLSEAGNLRDQRDALIDELAEFVDVTVIDGRSVGGLGPRGRRRHGVADRLRAGRGADAAARGRDRARHRRSEHVRPAVDLPGQPGALPGPGPQRVRLGRGHVPHRRHDDEPQLN